MLRDPRDPNGLPKGSPEGNKHMRKCLITHEKCNKHMRKLHVWPQWAPKRKPRGCQNAINTRVNAWSHIKNGINTWGSCMSGHLGMRFGTQRKIKSENAIYTWGNHINWTKKWINTWGNCMSGNAFSSPIFEKHQTPYRKSLFQGVPRNLS